MLCYETFVTFCLGAAGYGGLECLYRGRTHWTMLCAGGLCLLALQALNRRLAGRPLALRCLAGAGFITGFELAVGLLCNRLLGWRVWDYSAQWGNLWGQVCPRFSAYWYLLCLALLPVLDRADPSPPARPPPAKRRTPLNAGRRTKNRADLPAGKPRQPSAARVSLLCLFWSIGRF